MSKQRMGHSSLVLGRGRRFFTTPYRFGIPFEPILVSLFVLVWFFILTLSFTNVAYAANTAPSFDPMADQAVNEDASSQNVAITNVSDPESQTVTITASSGNTTLIPDPVISGSGATRTLTYTPAANQNGTATITVTADDEQLENNTFSRTFTVTVNPVNDPPSFDAIANQNVSENSSAQNVSITGISAGASNEASQTVTVTASSSDPALIPNPVVSAVSSGGATLTYTPATNQTGSATITVTADDGQGSNNTATRTFTITVSEDTTAPIVSAITPSLTTITEASVGTDTFTITVDYSEAMDQTSTPQIPFTPALEGVPQTLQGNDAASGWLDANTYVRHYNVIDNNVTQTGVDTSVTTAKDVAGNTQTSGSSTDAFNVDTAAPSISSVSFSPTSGARKIGDTITLTINTDAAGYTAGAITVNGVTVTGFTDAGSGVYTATYTVASGNTDRADADQIPVSVVLTDSAENSNSAFTTSPSADNSPSIDANVPNAPSAPNLNSTSDSGSSNSDDITNVTTPTFTLTAEVNSSLQIYDTDGSIIGGPSAPREDGIYAISTVTLSEGAHSITAKAIDAAGNASATSSALLITIDTSAPSTSVITSIATDNKINNSEKDAIVVNGTAEANSTVSVSLTSGETISVTTTADGSGDWAVMMSGSALTDGTVTPSVTSTDAAGNVSSAAITPTAIKDVVPPTVTVTMDDAALNVGDTSLVTFTFSEAPTGFTTDDVTVGNGTIDAVSTTTDPLVFTATYTPTDDVEDTTNVITVGTGWADAAGNTGVGDDSPNYVVDTREPTFTAARTALNTIVLTFSENVDASAVDETTAWTVAGATVAAVTDPANGTSLTITTTGLTATNGTPAVVYVAANGTVVDAAANEILNGTSANASDEVAPVLTSVSIASNNASTTLAKVDNTVTVSFTASEGLSGTPIVTIQGNAASVSGSSLYTATYTMQSGDAEGNVPFTIDFTDSASNAGTQVTAITSGSNVVFDKTAPTISLVGDAEMSIAYGVTYEEIGATADDGSTVNINGSVGTNVGDYTVTYDATDVAGNVASQVSRTVHVTKAPLTVTADDKSKTYGENNPELTATITGFVNGEVLGTSGVSGSASVSTTANTSTGVGTTTITVTAGTLAASNYSFSFAHGVLTIDRKAATITANPQSKTYGDPNPIFDATVDGAVNGDTLDYTLGTTADETSNVGGYEITVTPGVNANYNVTPVSGTLTIGKANASITVDGFSTTYDGAPHGASGTATGVNGENLSANLNSGETFTDVPGGTANWTFTGGQNYNDAEGTVSIDITKASAIISVIPYSEPYDNNPHSSTGTATGVLGEDLSVNLDLSGTYHTEVGDYSDSWTFTGGINYNNDDNTVSNSITPAPSETVVTCSESEEYTGSPVTACTASVTGVGNLNFTPDPVYSDNVEIGTATASYSFVGDANHTGSSDSKTFQIVDTIIPGISLTGDNPVTLEIHNEYADAGFSASDNHDGDITSSVTVDSSNVNKDEVGSYTVTYDVSDLSGNAAIQVERTVNVIDTVANAFDAIWASLVDNQSIDNNLSEVNTDNVRAFSGLYFEKSIDGEVVGRLTFTGPLDLSNDATQSFLQVLGDKLDQSNGRIAFDARESEVFAATGASLTMYNITPGVTESQLIVRDDSGVLLNPSDIVSGFSQDPETGDVTFTAAHFTQFDIDTTLPTFGPSPIPTGTTGETAIARVTAIDDIAVDRAQISVNGGGYVDMSFVAALDLKKRYTYDVSIPSDSTADITYQVKIIDKAGNEATSATSTITVTDNDVPEVNGLANDTTLAQSKTWSWGATDNVSSVFTYRYSIDQDEHGVPSGESVYSDATSTTQSAGDGTYYIHVQARDEAGNESSVATVSAVLDNTALPPESLEANSPTQTSLTLSWNNSESNGSYYTIKRSTSEITAENFDSATTLGGAPTVASGNQGYVAKNLSAGITYYFAIKMTDALGNISDIATTSGTTLASSAASSDTVAPSAVSDLRLSAGTMATSQIVLNWSATGDDGTSGIASKYVIKRSNAEITDTTWDNATTIFNSLAPKSNRSAETLTVGGLLSGTQYCFATKVQDEVPNTSGISNSVCLTTSANLPTVTSVTPSTGQNDGAIDITLTGTNFVTGTTTVRLTNTDNTFDLSGTYIDATHVDVNVPVGVPVGTYGIRVTNDNGTSAVLSSAYIVTAAPTPLPAVTDVVPSTVGTNDSNVDVEIYGTDFTGATGAVLDTIIPTTLTNFTVVSATKITATIPGTLAAGTYNVKVTTAAGTNTVSAVQVIAIAPVVINSNTSQDQVTDDPIDLGNTNTIPVQVTLQSNTSNSTLDNNTTIEVIIPPATTVTNADGSAYTGNINPPQLVKPTEEIESVAGSNAVVITMGNPEQAINFSNDFVTTVTLETSASVAPLIWYYNPSSGLEIAGKDGTKDGVTYAKGGTVLNTVVNGSTYTYTIGLLLDHMSSYVAGVTPTISGITPTSGISGSTVTITGTNFSPGATVKFGATTVSAGVVSVTQITATVPSLSTGSYTITVTNADNLSATSPTTFAITVQAGGGGTPGSYGSYGGGGGPTVLFGTTNTGGGPNWVLTTTPKVPIATATSTSPTASKSSGLVLGSTTYLFTKNLKMGSRGEAVAELQKRLTTSGVYGGPITSYFGPLTRAAVKKLQAKHGLEQVGAVGPLTRKVLNQ